MMNQDSSISGGGGGAVAPGQAGQSSSAASQQQQPASASAQQSQQQQQQPPRRGPEFQCIIMATSQGAPLFPLTHDPSLSGEEDEQNGATDASTDPSTAAAPSSSSSSIPAASPSSTTSTPSSSSTSSGRILAKCLLPLGNRPLLHFQLDMLARAGFQECLVVVRAEAKKEVARCIEEWRVLRGGAPTTGANATTVNLGASPASTTGAPLASPPSASILSFAASTNNSSTAPAPTPSASAPLAPSPLLDVDLVSLDRLSGSADAVRQLSALGKIHTDFFVVGADVVSNVQLQEMADVHRAQDAAVVMCVANAREALSMGAAGGASAATSAVDEKERKKQENEDASQVDSQFLLVDPHSNRLLLFQSQADVESSLDVRKSLLRAHPNVELHTRLKDAHVYLFSQWVVYLLEQKSGLSSIAGELIPALVAGQFKRRWKEWAGYSRNSSQQLARAMSHAPQANVPGNMEYADWDGVGGVTSTTAPTGAGGAAPGTNGTEIPNLNRALSELPASSSMTDVAGAAASNTQSSSTLVDNYRLYIFHARGATFCARANTLYAYKTLNHELAQEREYAYMPWPALALDNQADRLAAKLSSGTSAAGSGGKIMFGSHTIIGEGTSFNPDGNITIKRSCIGKHCRIGAKTKLQGCVIMDHVNIEDGCTLTDCIVSAHCTIGAGSTLKDCKVGPAFHAAAGSEFKNEILCVEDME